LYSLIVPFDRISRVLQEVSVKINAKMYKIFFIKQIYKKYEISDHTFAIIFIFLYQLKDTKGLQKNAKKSSKKRKQRI